MTMVTTTCFPSTASRRYSSFRTPYLASYVERKVVEHRDSGCNMGAEREGSGGEDVSSQRKRIAVACGRCRKRKIRCSGDAGNGQPCTNCKTAGYEPCQFLRVSSQEVSQVKGTAFSYNLDASRMTQARGSSSSSGGMAPLCIPVSPYAESLADSPSRAYSSKPYYGSSWSSSSGAYGEDAGVEYALSMQEPAYLAAPFRTATSAPHHKPPSMVYMDADGAYGYAAVTGAHRPPDATEACVTYPGLGRTGPERGAGLRTSAPAPHFRLDDYRKAESSVLDLAPGGAYHAYDAAPHLSYGPHSMPALSRSASSVFAPDSGLVDSTPVRASSGGSYRFADASFTHGGQHQQQQRHHRQASSADMASSSQGLVFQKESYGHESHRRSPARTRS